MSQAERNDLLHEAKHKADAAETALQLAYWRGCVFGLETALVELAALLDNDNTAYTVNYTQHLTDQ